MQATFQLANRRGGGTTHQFHLLRELARHGDVTVVAPDDGSFPSGAPDELRAFARLELVAVPEWSRNPARRALRLAEIAASRRPYAASRLDPLHAPVRAALASLPRPADVLYVEPSPAADWGALAPPGTPIAIGFHDLAFAALREQAGRAGWRPGRALAEVEWRKLRAYELRHAARADLCVMISAQEEAELRRLVPSARTVLVPTGVDGEYFDPDAVGDLEEDGLLVFAGSLNHPPNVAAAVRLARHILPAVRLRASGARLEIVGRAATQEVRALADAPGVEIVGEVDDIRPRLARAAVAVAPIEFGGGVRIKILEALAMRRAVVATPKAAEGLALRDGRELEIAPVERFADAVAALIRDPSRRAALGAAGRAFVLAEHDWAASGERLAAAFRALSSARP